MKNKVVYTTERGLRHQQDALTAAPDNLDITMLRQPDKATLMAHLADAEFLISERAGVIDAEIIQAAPHLKMIQRLGSLTYDIDVAAAQTASVPVCYWPVVGVIRVSEHLIMQLLTVTKKLRDVQAVTLAASPDWRESKRTSEDVFAYNWSGRTGVNQLWGRTVGIVGFGEIGAELARRLQGWGCTILYNKRRRLPKITEAELALTYVEADDLYAQSDYLVNLLPFFASTDLFLDAAVFAKMKTGAYLVSCGSGSVIDEAALAQAVQTGKLAGVALDTFEYEPIRSDNPLIPLALAGYNVLLTPHTAAGTEDSGSIGDRREQEYTNIRNFLAQRALQYRLV